MIEVKAADERPHRPSSPDPRWREGYHFNVYDPANSIGLSISVGIRPVLGVKEEVVSVHLPGPLVFLNLASLEGEDAAEAGSVRMEPLVPLKKWRIWMRGSFRETEDGSPTNTLKEAGFDLCFESDIPPYGYPTTRGERYEQPGSLRGEVRIGERTIDLEGTGIRDHSWETRDMSQWQEWYALMGWFESGEALNFARIRFDDHTSCDGWLRTDRYHEIRNVRVEPGFSRGVLRQCQMVIETPIETSKRGWAVNAQPISLVAIPLGEPGKGRLVETLVRLGMGETRGYGFLWYRS
jgi:hypothetical protein